MDSNEAIRRLTRHKNQCIEQVEQLAAMISSLEAGGLSPVTGTADCDRTEAVSRTTPAYPWDAWAQVNTTPETPPSSPSGQAATPTFHVVPRCECVLGLPQMSSVECAPRTFPVGCDTCGVLWAYARMPALDADPTTPI